DRAILPFDEHHALGAAFALSRQTGILSGCIADARVDHRARLAGRVCRVGRGRLPNRRARRRADACQRRAGVPPWLMLPACDQRTRASNRRICLHRPGAGTILTELWAPFRSNSMVVSRPGSRSPRANMKSWTFVTSWVPTLVRMSPA